MRLLHFDLKKYGYFQIKFLTQKDAHFTNIIFYIYILGFYDFANDLSFQSFPESVYFLLF
jgi:hypothetical protein